MASWFLKKQATYILDCIKTGYLPSEYEIEILAKLTLQLSDELCSCCGLDKNLPSDTCNFRGKEMSSWKHRILSLFGFWTHIYYTNDKVYWILYWCLFPFFFIRKVNLLKINITKSYRNKTIKNILTSYRSGFLSEKELCHIIKNNPYLQEK